MNPRCPPVARPSVAQRSLFSPPPPLHMHYPGLVLLAAATQFRHYVPQAPPPHPPTTPPPPHPPTSPFAGICGRSPLSSGALEGMPTQGHRHRRRVRALTGRLPVRGEGIALHRPSPPPLTRCPAICPAESLPCPQGTMVDSSDDFFTTSYVHRPMVKGRQ